MTRDCSLYVNVLCLSAVQRAWARAAAGMIVRLTHYFLGGDFPIDLLICRRFADVEEKLIVNDISVRICTYIYLYI